MAVSVVLWIVLIYLIAGLLFVLPFLLKGIKKIDEGAHGSSIGFYIIIIPGVIVFWPVLLRKWMKTPPSPKGE
jgi:Na+-driven multidrug efflux pump